MCKNGWTTCIGNGCSMAVAVDVFDGVLFCAVLFRMKSWTELS